MTTSKMKDADMPLRDRIEAAIKRVTTGHGQMRVPVEATDPDVVLADCLAELDAARARERHALVAGAEALRRIAAATPIGHEDVTKGPSTYTWLCYAASLLMAEAATTPATPLEQELITMRAREAKIREALRETPCHLDCADFPREKWCLRCAALAEGEDTPRPEVVEPPIQSVGQEPIKVANLMEALRRSLDAVLRQDPNMQVRAVRYSAEDTRG